MWTFISAFCILHSALSHVRSMCPVPIFISDAMLLISYEMSRNIFKSMDVDRAGILLSSTRNRMDKWNGFLQKNCFLWIRSSAYIVSYNCSFLIILMCSFNLFYFNADIMRCKLYEYFNSIHFYSVRFNDLSILSSKKNHNSKWILYSIPFVIYCTVLCCSVLKQRIRQGSYK